MLATHSKTLNILLADDDEADVIVTKRAFKRASMPNDINVVRDGLEVLSYLKGEDSFSDREVYPFPSLMLLDINMPKMNGIEVLRVIKMTSCFSMIPVVMLTSSKNEEDIKSCYQIGVSGYIQKPVEFEDFCKTVEGFNIYWKILNRLPPINDNKRRLL